MRKYRALSGKLHRQLTDIDEQLLTAAKQEGANVKDIIGESPPPTHNKNRKPTG